MKVCTILIPCLFFLFLRSFAQTGSSIIRGNIADSSTKENLDNGTVELMRMKDSVIIRKAVNQRYGFILQGVPAGEYNLMLSYIGYKNTILPIVTTVKDSVFNVGVLYLNKSSGELMEVVIKSTIPSIIVKSDTIIYNIDAFKTRPNASVEELLKKLPGMEVDKDGNVLFQGEKVQKIYVDGKEFFLSEPKLATQNLLADMVQKIEAFDEKSEKARLTGIPDNNPGKAINLQLKPDKKKEMFGVVEGGYASQDRYGLKGTMNYLKNDANLMVVVNSSNNDNMQSAGALNNKANTVSLNYGNSRNEKLRFTSAYSYNNNNSRNDFTSRRQTFFSDSALLQIEQKQTVVKTRNHVFGLSLRYSIDSFNSISGATLFNLEQNDNTTSSLANSFIEKGVNNQPINSAFTNNKSYNRGWNTNVNINYSHRFRKRGRYFDINLTKNDNKSNMKDELESLTQFYDGGGFIIDSIVRDQRILRDGNGSSLGLSLNYTEPIGKNQILDFAWQFNSSGNESAQSAFNFNPMTGKYDKEDTLVSNAFENSNGTQQVSIGYNYFKNKWRYQLGISVANNQQMNNNTTGNHEDIEQNFTNIFPRAFLTYSISKQKSLRLSYRGSTRPPFIAQLQPVPDYSNPLLIRLGNPSLQQEFENSIGLNYKCFDYRNSRSFLWQSQFSNTINKIANATKANTQGVQEQQYINIKGNYNVSMNIVYELSFGKKKEEESSSIKFDTRMVYGNDISMMNGLENRKRFFTLEQIIQFDYHKGDKFFVSGNARLNWNQSSYSMQTVSATSLLSQQYSCQISYEFSRSFLLSSDFRVSFTNSQRNLPGQNAVVWNAMITKRLLKNKCEAKLSIFDILNDSNNLNQYSGDNYIETTEVRVLKRVFMLSFVYRFRVEGI